MANKTEHRWEMEWEIREKREEKQNKWKRLCDSASPSHTQAFAQSCLESPESCLNPVHRGLRSVLEWPVINKDM